MGDNWRYGVVFDAGSSGTRVYIYKWKNYATATQHVPIEDLRRLPTITLVSSEKIRPGVASFALAPEIIGSDHLESLVELALDEVSEDKVPDTPIYLMATAGMRLLPEGPQQGLLQAMCSYLRDNTDFLLPDCSTNVQVISGETEGLYGWLAANYLLGGFDKSDDLENGNGHHTYGFLDMGGASAQIAFVPNTTEAEKHAEDLKLVRLRNLDGTVSEYKVFTTSWLGYGANQARERYIHQLLDAYGRPDDLEVPDPCMPRGLRTTLDDGTLPSTLADSGVTLVGTGNFRECLATTEPLLGKDAPCPDEPCLLNGQHVPTIDFSINRFVGVSEYWHTTHGVFSGKHKAYDLVTYERKVLDFCSRHWDGIVADAEHIGTKGKVKDAQEACFKASWLINILYEGIGFPRVGMEYDPSSGLNISDVNIEATKEKSPWAPFQPVNKIDGMEVSWTLGKMILYASGQIIPQGQSASLPVGFGSNVAGATDFELAGSTYDPTLGLDEGNDWDGAVGNVMGKARTNFTIILLVLLAAFMIFLLHKRDRRARWISRISATLRLNRFPTGPLKFGRGSSFTNKLFGRRTPYYERLMEEGGVGQFELGNLDADEYSVSDMNDVLQARRSPRLFAPNITLEPFEEARFGQSLDRGGVAVRTESRERLVPNLVNAGKRSRAGSPTRLKAPSRPL
ncbi:golgi apyrase [Sodiomyces alkalinus F11]|uniref:Golgi apyrase n=1 Tax=Sodiomyces alkalinus (strain CBS 110278 / VKM F-3762 / F11) TaxID=1314773 RepID=A0A3N2Q4T0_SODAK|nr:golgi apyrase [Sodiomyces alkalinus F11]ROT41780.1 golgi apyrase [Sodiomyces alkalinus F11]